MACETVCTFFYVFLRFFQNPKKHDFLRFFELLHTFSRTVPDSRINNGPLQCQLFMSQRTRSSCSYCSKIDSTLHMAACKMLICHEEAIKMAKLDDGW